MTKEQAGQLIGKPIVEVFTFKGDPNDTFKAYSLATAKLKELGVSHGSMQREAPIGLAYGDVDISKWRDLGEDVQNLDGVMLCGAMGFRNGTVTVFLTAKSNDEAA